MSDQTIPTHNLDSSHDSEKLVTITAQSGLDGYRRRNFYLVNFFQGALWMIFHFAVVFFFTFQLQSVTLVGVFLGFANLISFLLDIPLGIVVKQSSPKRLFLIAAGSQLVAIGVLFSLIFGIVGLIGTTIPTLDSDMLKTVRDWFFGSAISIVGLLIASVCYGLTKELYDITNFSYILSNAHPSEYAEILARNNISAGVGSLLGLLASGAILGLGSGAAIFILIGLILVFMAFTYRFFHNATETIHLEDIEKFVVSIKSLDKENLREYIKTTVSKAELAKVLSKTKYLFIKPHQPTKETINWKSLLTESKQSGRLIYTILSKQPIEWAIIWTMSLVLTFGFWDTFASTFLINFLDEVKHGYSYLLLGVIAIPAYGLQEFFGKLADRLGTLTVGMIGLALSGGSLIMMGILSLTTMNPLIIMLCALVNSIGYSAGMCIGQNKFLEEYNEVYAKEMNLKEIDANASSGPMKILQNLANVIGLSLGGLLLALPGGYSTFFILFGGLIIGLVVWSVRVRGEVKL